MDLLFNRYASPFLILDQMLEAGRFSEFINELYKDYNIHVIEAKRNINANGKKRGNVEEVIITNYIK